MKRIPLRGAEQDALTGWRHVLKYLSRSKVRKALKASYNRRFRKAAKADFIEESGQGAGGKLKK